MKKLLFLLITFGFLSSAFAFPQIETKTIFEAKRIGLTFVTLKTEIYDSKFYDIDCLICLEKAIEISRIAFRKFCKEIFPTRSDCWNDIKKRDVLTIVFVSHPTMNKIRKYFSMPIDPKIITLGMYDYNKKTIYITIFSNNFYYFDYLSPLLHELCHYYFDIYDLTPRVDIAHVYINLYIDFIFEKYSKELLLDSFWQIK